MRIEEIECVRNLELWV